MPFQPVAQTALCTLEGRVDRQLTILDLAFQNSADVNIVNLSALVSTINNWFQTQLAPLLSENWTTIRTVGVDLSDPIGPRIEESGVTIGGVAGEAAPNNVAACVSLRTAQRGRSARGRNFVPGIPNSVISLNTLDSGFISDLTGAYNNLVGPGGIAIGWQLVIVSRRSGGEERVEGISIPVIEATMVGNSVRSMRSREIGHGA